MNLNFIAPICETGYGVVGTNLLVSLMNQGIKVALFPIGNPSFHGRLHKYIVEALNNADSFDKDADCIRLWHQWDLSMFVGHGKHIGFPIFELTQFSDREKHHIKSLDSIIVCNQFSVDAINKLNIQAPNYYIHKVPLGVDTDVFFPTKSNRNPTIFLNVGKWEVRKGHDVIVEAFNKAFNVTSNVELWMMCDNFLYTREQNDWWAQKYKNSNLRSKIRILPRQETDIDVANIMRQADCGVFPARAEGWNLELLEMLSCGKQVITTNYSGHKEFCNKDNSKLLEVKEVEPALDATEIMPEGKWFRDPNKTWAKIDVDNLAELMLEVHAEKIKNGFIYNEAGVETARKLSWNHCATEMLKIFDYLES